MAKTVLVRGDVIKATQPGPWDFSNSVLYDLCIEHPRHTDQGEVLAKILIIGRVYAAAIERRRLKEVVNDDFYISTVARTVMNSDIDRWIGRAKAVAPTANEALDVMVEVHGLVTDLFNEISHLEKRALASKYLHFHVPSLFYLYDSRAQQGLRMLNSIVGRASKNSGAGDNEYRKFAEKCRRLQRHCAEALGVELSPRQLDNLLLALAAIGTAGHV